MSMLNRIRCIVNGHQFSAPQQQECWWVIECRCCGAARTADSVLEFLVSPISWNEVPDIAANGAEELPRATPVAEHVSPAPLFPSQSFQARPV